MPEAFEKMHQSIVDSFMPFVLSTTKAQLERGEDINVILVLTSTGAIPLPLNLNNKEASANAVRLVSLAACLEGVLMGTLVITDSFATTADLSAGLVRREALLLVLETPAGYHMMLAPYERNAEGKVCRWLELISEHADHIGGTLSSLIPPIDRRQPEDKPAAANLDLN